MSGRLPSAPVDDREYCALLELSAKLGADPLRTQAAGGNTSFKRDGVMWIKASGTWLAEALAKDIMTPVLLEPLRKAIADGDPRAATAIDFVPPKRSASGLRPSIETSVHAVTPWPVVVHIHCVNTITFAVRTDSEALVAERLRFCAGVSSVFVPYKKPGFPLAKAILERSAEETNVVVLGNHGLVVAGQTVAEVDDRIESVCAALSAPARSAPPADIEKLTAIADGGDYRVPEDPAAHAVALDPINLATARQGSLYPDHVVFLGPGLVEGTVKNGRLDALAESPRPPLMLALPGLGVLLHRSVSRGADAMARCLADVAARIPEGVSIRTLTAADERELLNWEAETYRQSLGR
jgi:rhamnose utilization protein RhaD (predicted bifunctional aldolase and dehydrogenase)